MLKVTATHPAPASASRRANRAKVAGGMALSGRVAEDDRTLLLETRREMCGRGAQAVLLAGTDLFLAFDGRDPGFEVIDTALLHVQDLKEVAAR